MSDPLDLLVGPAGRGAGPWATEPVRHLAQVVTLRADGRMERGAPARADPGALPVPTSGLDGMVVRGLHLARSVDAVFAELRRVLRPAGTLVVVVPSMSVRTPDELRWRAALRPVRRGPWPHRSALDGAGWLLAAADFAVVTDDRGPFALPLPDADAARRAVRLLPAAGLWPPGMPPGTTAGLVDELVRRCGPRAALPVPLRRLVARR